MHKLERIVILADSIQIAGANDRLDVADELRVGARRISAPRDTNQALIHVQLHFVRFQFTLEEHERHVDAEVLHAGSAPEAAAVEHVVRGSQRSGILVKSPSGQKLSHGARMRKVEDAVRFLGGSRNNRAAHMISFRTMLSLHNQLVSLLKVVEDVHNRIAGLHPVDIITVAIFVVVKQIIDVLKGEQIGVRKGGAPRG